MQTLPDITQKQSLVTQVDGYVKCDVGGCPARSLHAVHFRSLNSETRTLDLRGPLYFCGHHFSQHEKALLGRKL